MSFNKRPPATELAEMLNQMRHKTAVARHYGASRQAVHEWIAFYVGSNLMIHDCRWIGRPAPAQHEEATHG